MSALTKRDAIDAAMAVAEDVAEGKIEPAALDQAVAGECRELFGTVVGDGDPLWDLHIDVCRQALALGALTADELSEWLAVARSRVGERVDTPEEPNDPPLALPPASGPFSPEIAVAKPDLSDDDEPEPEPDPAVETDSCCVTTNPKMVALPDGSRIPSRLIIARGHGLPDPGYGLM